MRMRRAAIYTRVSTSEQTTENQACRLREVAARAGWHVVATYDETASGAASPDRRTQYAFMLKDAGRRRFDILLVWDVSRLGRSLSGLVALMEELRTLKVDLYIDQQGLDTTTPSGRAMFQMAGVFAEFERGMLIERTRAGMARARACGTHIGRPRVSDEMEQRVKAMRQEGVGINRIAASLKVGKSVVARIVAHGS